jgi:cytochrome c biogenesis protein CcmG, thiol:disulfide interchange protein DsbE
MDDHDRDPDLPADPPSGRAVQQTETGFARPRRSSGARTTLLLGLAVTGAFIVGMIGVTVLAGADRPPTAGDGVLIDTPGSLTDRVAPTEQQPLPESVLAGFGEDAEPVALTAYRGSPLVVNFWASWCAPCVKEMPDFQRFSEQMGDQVPLLGVNVQDAPANAQSFVDELEITYDLAADPRGDLYSDIRGFGMPTTLFVDAEGMIRYRFTGPLDLAELLDLVDEHLGVRPTETGE